MPSRRAEQRRRYDAWHERSDVGLVLRHVVAHVNGSAAAGSCAATAGLAASSSSSDATLLPGAATLLPDGALDAGSLTHFETEGFLCFPSLLSDRYADQLVQEMNQLPLVGDGPLKGSGPMECFRFCELGGVPTLPALVTVLEQIFGGRRFAMHHLNAQVQFAGDNGNSWHHDYPSGPPCDPCQWLPIFCCAFHCVH